MGSRRRSEVQAGFTLIEAMVVVTVIGIAAAMMAPALAETVANSRQRTAAAELRKVADFTGSRANETQTAFALRFRKDENGKLGQVESYMGMNRRCAQTDWEQAFDKTTNMGRWAVLNMAQFNPIDGTTAPQETDTGRHVIKLRASWPAVGASPANPDLSSVVICFQPNGTNYIVLNPPIGPLALVQQAAGLTFRIERTMDGSPRGVTREVFLPASGMPRLR